MDQKQRTLKIVVILLGVALLICAAIVFGTIARRAAGLGKDKAPPPAAQLPAAKAIGNVDVPIPYGAKVVAVGGDGRELRVLLDLPEGRELMLVDRQTGGVLGTLHFVPRAPGPAAPGAPAAP